jgi:hypothetical protein
MFALLFQTDFLKETLERIIKIAQGVLYDPLRDFSKPGQVFLFACRQFFLKINT